MSGLYANPAGTLDVLIGGQTYGQFGSAPTVPTKVATAVSAGDATRFDQVIGLGQTRQTVTGSRAINGTVYTNYAAKPRIVTISVSNSTTTGFNLAVTTGATTTNNYQPNTIAAGNVSMTVTFLVLVGESYSCTGIAATLTSWTEIS